MERHVSFYSDGLKLDGVLSLPDDLQPGQKRPAIAICHGFTQHKEIFSLSYGAALARHGFVALSFDYRGFGGSEGQRGRLIPLEQVEDARSAGQRWDPNPLGVHRLRLWSPQGQPLTHAIQVAKAQAGLVDDRGVPVHPPAGASPRRRDRLTAPHHGTSPSSCPRRAAWVRVSQSSLARMWATCISTVRGLRIRLRAISRFV